jgi:hypothetical protein
MKHTKLALGTLVVALGLLMASPAWAALAKVADWRMNERSGPMIDSSRYHNNGNPKQVVPTGRPTASTARPPAWPCETIRASIRRPGTSR